MLRVGGGLDSRNVLGPNSPKALSERGGFPESFAEAPNAVIPLTSSLGLNVRVNTKNVSSIEEEEKVYRPISRPDDDDGIFVDSGQVSVHE